MTDTISDAAKSAAPNARAASAERTRRKLVASAAALFAEKGLTKPSLDAICAHAGFTRGAFYVHFKTRDDLIVAVVEEIMGTFIDAIVAGGEMGGDIPTIVQMFIMSVESGAFPFPGQVRPHQILEASVRSEKLRDKYLELLQKARTRLAAAVVRGQQTGSLREDADPDAVAQLLLAMVLGVEVASELDFPYDAGGVGQLVLRLLKPGT